MLERFRLRFNLDKRTVILIAVACAVMFVSGMAAYIVTGVLIKADVPIVRKLVQPEVVAATNKDAYNIAVTWKDMKVFSKPAYVTMFKADETEDQFYQRMSDLDRRSVYQLTQKYPKLLANGLSNLSFDAMHMPVSDLLTEEENISLKTELEMGAVKTKQGHTVLAVEGKRSMLLVGVNLNETPGYMVMTYDKSKLGLSVTDTAFEGWWSTVAQHTGINDGAVAAMPANNYTDNAKAGYGVVDGGFVVKSVEHYKPSGNFALYMGFNNAGVFTVGDQARYGNTNFTEGLGVLLTNGAVPVVDLVPVSERNQIFSALATYIKSTGKNPEAKNYDGVPVIEAFIGTFDSSFMKAKAAWVVKNKTLTDAVTNKLVPEGTLDLAKYVAAQEAGAGASKALKDAARLVAVCDKLGASQFVTAIAPVRSAYNAIGQRASDGATVLFGIGGSKVPDSRDLPGNGATIDELQQLMLQYSITNAAVVTSGSRVGLGWKDLSLLKVQDTSEAGGRAYGAYILK